ncbi:uncharacterized protein BDZ99DRAFT_514161 [Mytilinidion resinicola]|uniref:Uncharacterized protein n=1 Tax=Mytilinidion resinicola TaxID=574789 RepID=A0A6A6Z9Z4_9PEZI|nr:uncharacterized protein BDZ99DRAFT_514161 [Mytilinidion resinicola]KAF2817941.1 hypothetical protein BDZ99DRAFT_514161 [Mytilinidion resinicola]
MDILAISHHLRFHKALSSITAFGAWWPPCDVPGGDRRAMSLVVFHLLHELSPLAPSLQIASRIGPIGSLPECKPSDTSGTHRKVLILGIPHYIHLHKVFSSVTSGAILPAPLGNASPISGFQIAYLLSVEEAAAVALTQAAPLFVKGLASEATVQRSVSPFSKWTAYTTSATTVLAMNIFVTPSNLFEIRLSQAAVAIFPDPVRFHDSLNLPTDDLDAAGPNHDRAPSLASLGRETSAKINLDLSPIPSTPGQTPRPPRQRLPARGGHDWFANPDYRSDGQRAVKTVSVQVPYDHNNNYIIEGIKP